MSVRKKAQNTTDINILKVRDDGYPIRFASDGDENSPEFTTLCNESKPEMKLDSSRDISWTSNGKFARKDLRNRIEPWLTSLFQSEHLSLLAGAGLSLAVHSMSAGAGGASMAASNSFGKYKDVICEAAQKTAKAAGREEGNVEDQLRVANELLRGLKIIKKEEDVKELGDILINIIDEFSKAVLDSERRIAVGKEGGSREKAFNTLVTFLMSFASRTGTRGRLNIFTTNYDRVIEAGAELAGLHLLDRFVGNLSPIFRSSRLDLDMHYNPPGIRGEPRYLEGVARFTKLHGSLDWVQVGKDIRRIGLPFGAESIDPYLNAPGLMGARSHELMIYPNAAKDRETADYPYVELFRDLAAAVCRPNSTLVTYGYSFGDEHINRVIRDMLTIPSTHLVVIAFSDKPLGRIMQTYEDLGRPSQISLLVGSELGDLEKLTNYYLPKAAIDKTTIRMSELLTRRWGAQRSESVTQSVEQPTGSAE